MREPLSTEELEELREYYPPSAPESSLPPVHRLLATIDELCAALAQHSEATDVSNSDMQLLRLSVESLMGSLRGGSHE